MNIYDSIKELCRKNSNLKICELEKQLGFTENLLSKWAKASPTINNLLKVAEYFNVSLDYFVGRTVAQPTISNENGIVGNNNAMTNSNNFSPNDNQSNNLSDIEKALLEVSKDLTVMQKIDVINYAREIVKK